MEIKSITPKHWKPIVLSILYTVGIVGISIEMTRDFFLGLSSIHLTVCLLLSTPLLDKNYRPQYLFLVGIIGYFAEVIGVNTGIIFGDYEYLDNLGPKLIQVPVLLVALWIMSLYGAYSIASLITKNKWFNSLLTAVLCTCLDILIEPLCATLGYWEWTTEVGLNNFITWFILSLFLAHFIKINKILPQKEAIINFVWQIVFFLLLNFMINGELQY